jgi:hypothetical protein
MHGRVGGDEIYYYVCARVRLIAPRQGTLAVRNFKNWNVETASTERAAQFVLRQHNCEQYYGIALAALQTEGFGSKSLNS